MQLVFANLPGGRALVDEYGLHDNMHPSAAILTTGPGGNLFHEATEQ